MSQSAPRALISFDWAMKRILRDKANFKEGIRQGKLATAKVMVAKGLAHTLSAEVTGLSAAEIAALEA